MADSSGQTTGPLFLQAQEKSYLCTGVLLYLSLSAGARCLSLHWRSSVSFPFCRCKSGDAYLCTGILLYLSLSAGARCLSLHWRSSVSFPFCRCKSRDAYLCTGTLLYLSLSAGARVEILISVLAFFCISPFLQVQE